MRTPSRKKKRTIEAIDLFCGAGGLTRGLIDAGIKVKAGIDLDKACRFPYEANNAAKFIEADVGEITGALLKKWYAPTAVKVLAGCAPCQPFSTLAKDPNRSSGSRWKLLEEFARLVEEVQPDVVTMENVPRVRNHAPYKTFEAALKRNGYHVAAGVLRCASFGVPQERRRFVLLASRLGPISLPAPLKQEMTVQEAIGHLPPVAAGDITSKDLLHRARGLSPVNLQRIQASVPGGTWEDWPAHLRAPCHRTESGQSFKSVYARMRWDRPAPTITTQCHNFGTGRFGHPEQDRAITLREAAILQSFPSDYRFVQGEDDFFFSVIARLIGNAVPPLLGKAVGIQIKNHIQQIEG